MLKKDPINDEIKKFVAPLFTDATGHGYIAMKAGAEGKMEEKGRMGMSNMWTWEDTDKAQSFPETPWALKQNERSFPYPRKYHAEWFWERQVNSYT